MGRREEQRIWNSGSRNSAFVVGLQRKGVGMGAYIQVERLKM